MIIRRNKSGLLKDKRAGEKYLTIWWFLVLVIIGVGIVAMVLVFYGAEINVKGNEAEVLYKRISNCLIDSNGVLKSEALAENFKETELLKKCNLDEKIITGSGNYFIKISVLDSGNNLVKEIKLGTYSYEGDCNAVMSSDQKNVIEARHYPGCFLISEDVFYNLNNVVGKGKINILTASNQEETKSAN